MTMLTEICNESVKVAITAVSMDMLSAHVVQ